MKENGIILHTLTKAFTLVIGIFLGLSTAFSQNYQNPVAETNDSLNESQSEKESPVRSITVEELRDHMFFLASDSLRGRVTGTPGYRTAARYAEREFRSAGLRTILKDSLGDGTYLQTVPFVRKDLKDIGELVIQSADGKTVFKENEDFKFLIFKANDLPSTPLPLVFVGYGIEEPENGWNDYEGLDLEDKVAIMLPGAPKRGGEPVLPPKLDQLYSTGNGDGKRFHALFKRRPAALLLLSNPWRSQNWEKLANGSKKIKILYRGSWSLVPTKYRSSNRRGCQIVIRENVLEALFSNQEYSPMNIKKSGIEGYTTFDLKDVSVYYRLVARGEKFNSWNVVAMVEGIDPLLKNQVITVGAHLDHVKGRNGQICNGADDNASGSVGVLEIAEAVAMQPPRRSVLFILYTAEELGLIGSRHFVNNCPVDLNNVIVNINLDMIGRTCNRLKDNRAHYIVGSENVNPEFKNVIVSVNENTVNWPLVFKANTEFRGGSDHLSYDYKDIPSAFFFSGEHEDLHKPTDDPEKIEYDKMQKISQLVYEIVMELGNRDKVFGVGE